jgi:hypothetical protein
LGGKMNMLGGKIRNHGDSSRRIWAEMVLGKMCSVCQAPG